jgi:flavin-dependent dehydrogenase
MSMPDVTIIGAGPAGSLAAFALAARGWQVTLIEQHRFPRDKVCGESLSALGIEVLARLNLANRLRALNPSILTYTALHSSEGRELLCPLPRPMWGLSRRAMDTELVNAAKDAGARVLQPARCESITPHLTVRHLQTNQVELLNPTWTIIADGKGALLPHRPAATRDLGIKAHFESVDGPHDAVELFGVRGHYVGLAPVENGRFNVAFSLPLARLTQFQNNLDPLWQQILTENRTLARRFARARRIGGWLASPLPRFPVARRWPARVIPLGNAAAALEPIGGEGMGLALRSAELAADALDQSQQTQTPLPVARLRSQFATLWRTRRLTSRMLAQLLSNPALASDALEWANLNQSLPNAALRLVGKT